MEAELLDKYKRAGLILSQVLLEARPKVKVGASLLEVAEFVEGLIRSKGASPAFPCNISLDRAAAHYTPSPEDKGTFGENMVKLDVGVHVDGYIADAAITVDLSGHEKLTEASYAGLDAGWEQATPGSSELNNWLNATAILRWQANKWLALALRGEYYDDPAGVIISTGTPNGMQTFGWSANADVQVARHLLWRTEFRSFSSQDAIFVKGSGYATGNNAITTSLAVWF